MSMGRRLVPSVSVLLPLLTYAFTAATTRAEGKPKTLADLTVRDALCDPESLAALAVAALNLSKITMYGATITAPKAELAILAAAVGDPAAARRATYQAHPYRKIGAGVNCFVIGKNPAGAPCILLGSKKKEPGVWIVPGGYLQNFPALGYQGVDQNDAAEEALLCGESPDLKLPVVKGLKVDADFVENFRRELEEETGIVLAATAVVSLLRANFTYDSIKQPLHTIEGNMLTVMDHLPVLKPGDDLDHAEWVPLSHIEVNKTGQYVFGGHVIKPKYQPDIDAAIQAYYSQELKKLTQGKFDSFQQLSLFDATLSVLMAGKPKHEAGLESASWYQRFLIAVKVKMERSGEPLGLLLRGEGVSTAFQKLMYAGQVDAKAYGPASPHLQ